jgi:hypothetical protein
LAEPNWNACALSDQQLEPLKGAVSRLANQIHAAFRHSKTEAGRLTKKKAFWMRAALRGLWQTDDAVSFKEQENRICEPA